MTWKLGMMLRYMNRVLILGALSLLLTVSSFAETATGTAPAGQAASSSSSADQASTDAITADQTLTTPSADQTSTGATSSDQASANAMSADQIIAILESQPQALASAKRAMGLEIGADPAAISDQDLFDRLRQDAALRQQATDQLQRQGYAPGVQTATGSNRNRTANGPSSTALQAPPQSQGEDQPQLKELRAPYRNLPSLPTLYSQIVPGTAKLRRFGSDMFETGTGNTNELPMDLPVGPDYVLGPGDNLIINMWGGQSARLNRTIDRQGQVALPEAGTVTITGMTLADAQNSIQKALSSQYQNEHVEISLGRVRTVRVYVVGDVQRPGAYDVSSLSTPLNALYAAGGPTSRGSLRILKQVRGEQVVHEIDLYDFLLHGVRSDVGRLLPGDTILVPPVGPQVSVGGMVRRPAIYELKGHENLDDVLNLAGGILVSADTKQIRVERIVAHQRRTMLSVQLPDGSSTAATKLPAFPVQDGDAVQVSSILPYNNQVVYLDGHVFKPGAYAWHEGMTVNDLIHSYQDIMPEPADHAELIRLLPPDFKPETISLNLPDVLIGNDTIALQPFDTVRIFGRYDVDAPKVSIYGQVLRPGSYPMSQGMTVADLVRMAGGFNRSAYRDEADLSSYEVQNGEKVEIGHSGVAIQKALDGDKSADVELKPGDVVGIRQLTGWNDIGSSITIQGEVRYAGTYGLQEGERLSSVVRRAGGFRNDAYPQGAVLERVEVRQLEETGRQQLIRRIETSIPAVAPGAFTTAQDQQSQLQAMQQQRQEVLTALRNQPVTGRVVIKISADIRQWENTPADIVLRAGDKLVVPKQPDFVLVSGQVYNSTGITYRPGKDAAWYLDQAGGATRYGDKGQIFILRADGSVVGNAKNTIFSPGVLSTRMHPGDAIIVPEKVVGGSMLWRNLIGTAQVMSSVAITGALTGAW